MRTIILISLILITFALFSCSKEDPDRSGYLTAATVAADLTTDSIIPWVERFTLAHLNDTPG